MPVFVIMLVAMDRSEGRSLEIMVDDDNRTWANYDNVQDTIDGTGSG